MIPNLFILNNSGDVLIEKHFVGVTKRMVCDLFWEQVSKYDAQKDVPPLVTTENWYMLSVRSNSMFYLVALRRESAPMVVLTALHNIIDILRKYFASEGGLKESMVRENFSVVYQLLDEVVVCGFPHTCEMNQLTDMISPPSMVSRIRDFTSSSGLAVKSTLPSAFNNTNMPWRKPDCRYVTNEVKIDIIEAIDCIIQTNNSGGQSTVASMISGSFECNAKLSGQPDLCLNLTGAGVLDHVTLHRCVRISRWQKEKVISFIPPDGQFTLATYKLKESSTLSSASSAGPLPLMIDVNIQQGTASSTGAGSSLSKRTSGGISTLSHGTCQIKVTLSEGKTDSKTLDKVVIEVPFPKECNNIGLTGNVGKVITDEISKVVRWEIGKFSATAKDGSRPTLEGTVQLNSDSAGVRLKPVVRARFEVKGLSMSGVKVASLAVHGVKYKPFKGVRHICKAGRFIVRT